MKTFDDYGPRTDHPHDPRNTPDESGAYEAEQASDALQAALRAWRNKDHAQFDFWMREAREYLGVG